MKSQEKFYFYVKKCRIEKTSPLNFLSFTGEGGYKLIIKIKFMDYFNESLKLH